MAKKKSSKPEFVAPEKPERPHLSVCPNCGEASLKFGGVLAAGGYRWYRCDDCGVKTFDTVWYDRWVANW